jgi:hypothetical protein
MTQSSSFVVAYLLDLTRVVKYDYNQIAIPEVRL